MFYFIPPENVRKLTFLGGIEMKVWLKWVNVIYSLLLDFYESMDFVFLDPFTQFLKQL